MAKSKDLRIYFPISEIRVCYIRKILEGCVICCISVRAKRVLGISVSALERFFAEQASIECVVTGGVIGRPQFVQLGFNSFFLFPNPSLTIQLRRINFLRSLKATLPRTCKINCYTPQVAWLHVRLVNIGSTMLVTSGQCWQTAWPMECFLSIGATQAKRVEHTVYWSIVLALHLLNVLVLQWPNVLNLCGPQLQTMQGIRWPNTIMNGPALGHCVWPTFSPRTTLIQKKYAALDVVGQVSLGLMY